MSRRNPDPLGGRSNPEHKMIPFPGYIDESRWRIQNGRYPSFILRSEDEEEEGFLMQVPLADKLVNRKIRLHEQAHVAWTPNLSRVELAGLGIQEKTLNAVEDARVIQIMNARVPEWKELNLSSDANMLTAATISHFRGAFGQLALKLGGHEVDETVERTMSLLDAAILVAASEGYYESAHFEMVASETGLGWVVELVRELHEDYLGDRHPTFEDAVKYGIALERHFSDLQDQIEEQNAALAEADLPTPHHPEPIDIDAPWGEMLIEQAPLTERLQGLPSKRTRATDLGTVPRYMHRLLSDQRVFGRRRKSRQFQGTVLIDHSGSMSLSPEQVDEILFRWPAVTIATYSGHDTYGILRIVAKNRRRASVDYLDPPAGGDNLIDGPALDWLATQRGPRVWISDGGVTGIGGQTPGLLLDAARKMKRGKIKRIPDVQNLLES